MKNRKYDIEIDGYRIRNNADFNRVDMSKSQRNRYNRRMKLEKKNIIREEKLLSLSKCNPILL